ncbi:MAG: hypothetical protein NVS2B9_12410 [Myxococcales bacterium]
MLVRGSLSNQEDEPFHTIPGGFRSILVTRKGTALPNFGPGASRLALARFSLRSGFEAGALRAGH